MGSHDHFTIHHHFPDLAAGSPIVLDRLVNVLDTLAYTISRRTYTDPRQYVPGSWLFHQLKKTLLRAVHVNGWVWWLALPRVSNGAGTRAALLLIGVS